MISLILSEEDAENAIKWAWTEAKYKEAATPTSWKEKEGEGAGSSESVDGRRGDGDEQMREASTSDVG